MNSQKTLLILGLILLIAGLIFALQGSGILGPRSSSMFMNRGWTFNGSMIAAVGLATIAASVIWKKDRAERAHEKW